MLEDGSTNKAAKADLNKDVAGTSAEADPYRDASTNKASQADPNKDAPTNKAQRQARTRMLLPTRLQRQA